MSLEVQKEKIHQSYSLGRKAHQITRIHYTLSEFLKLKKRRRNVVRIRPNDEYCTLIQS